MKTRPLTIRQREVYEYLVRHVELAGRQPTIREISEEFGVQSPNGVACHLKALETKGWIRRPLRGGKCVEFTRVKFLRVEVGGTS